MKCNPGGIVAGKDVRGRDQLIASLWKTLDKQSVVLAAERRMGKTTVIRKMADEPPDGTKVILRDVEGVGTTMEFVGRLIADANPHLTAKGRAHKAFGDFWAGLGGLELGGVIKFPPTAAGHWKVLLERVVSELGQLKDTRMLLVWDEMPLMLQNINAVEGPRQVMELLSTLRALRQAHEDAPRMIFTGSIGLHHVIAELRDQRYANSPLNDMRSVSVDPLAVADARALALELFNGERLGADVAAAAGLVELVDCVPFYIHQVVHALATAGLAASVASVEQLVSEALRDPHDAWDLQNFRTRLDNYYGVERAVVEVVLEQLAQDEPLLLPALADRVARRVTSFATPLAARIVQQDRAALSSLLALMQKDHYLLQDGQGAYRFRFGVVRRWWQLH